MKSGLPRDFKTVSLAGGCPGYKYHIISLGVVWGWSWLNRGLGFLEKREKDGDARIIVVEKGKVYVGSCGNGKPSLREEGRGPALDTVPCCGRFQAVCED